MNNNAFKDLVRAHGANNSSSKAIARKAVEEEFRKKKRKRAGDYSSSDEDDNNHSSYKSSKRQQKQENKEEDDDEVEAIQKDLAARYRDRAKERREGKVADKTDEKSAAATPGSSNHLLIVPHNKKGLDLALVRKERLELQSRSGGGNRISTTTTSADKDDKESQNKMDSSCKTRDKMPSLNEAHQILQAFLSAGKEKNINGNYNNDSPPTIQSNGLVEYLSEILSWKTLDVTKIEGENAAASRKSLQNTVFSLAIDGSPSDPTRAWEIPRQYNLSQGGGSGGDVSSSAFLPITVMNKIDAVFRKKNSIREEMMEGQTSKARNDATSNVKNEKAIKSDGNNNSNTSGVDDESDDDMFAD